MPPVTDNTQPQDAEQPNSAPIPSAQDTNVQPPQTSAGDNQTQSPAPHTPPVTQKPPDTGEKAAPSISDDQSSGLTKHLQNQEQQDAKEWFDSITSGKSATSDNRNPSAATDDSGTANPANDKSPNQINLGPQKAPKNKSILLDIVHGATQWPSEVAGGVLDAYDGISSLADSIGEFVGSKLPKGVPFAYDSSTGKFLDSDEYKAAREKDPRSMGSYIPIPDTTTGKLIRGMSQFMSGFLTTGAASDAAGISAGILAQSAFTDYSFFEGHSGNLANLINEFPKLKNPVTNLLATSPDDSDATGRFKNVVAGAIPGFAAGALVEGIANGLRFMQKSGGSAYFGKMLARQAGHEVDEVKSIEPHELESLGDPNADTLLQKKMDAAESRTAGIQPSDVKGQLKKAPEYEINFAAINTSDDVKTTMRKMAQREKSAIDESGRKVQSHEETNAKADQIDAFDTLSERRQGEPLNAEEIVAARRMYVASAEKLREMANVASKSPTPANLFMFEKMAQIHSMIQSEVLGASAEIGRALNAHRIPVGSSSELAKQISEILDAQTGGDAAALAKAKKVAALADAGKQSAIDNFVNGTLGKKVYDAISQVYVSSLLSLKTVSVKFGSDMANALYQMGVRRNAAFIGQKLGTEGAVEAGEALAGIHGMLTAWGESLYALGQKTKAAFAEEGMGAKAKALLNAPRDAVKGVPGAYPFDPAPVGKLAAENWQTAQKYPWMGKLLNTAEYVTRFNSRLIETVDQFSKTLIKRGETEALALRKAVNDFKGQDVPIETIKKRAADYVEKTPELFDDASTAHAEYTTFTSDPSVPLKKLGNAVQNLPFIGRVLLPFKNVPINIFTQTMEGTPLAPLVRSWRADLAAGGARADLALSRMITGTSLLSLSMDMAFRGIISGKGPDHPGERANWLRMGNQPESVTLPDGKTRIAYNRLDPLGFTLGIGADIAEAIANAEKHVEDRDFVKVMSGAVFAISNNVLSKTYLRSISDLLVALHEPQSGGEKYIKHLLASSVPQSSNLKAVTGAVDPYARAADGMVDEIRKIIPGISATLPLQRNIWGDPLSHRSPAGAAYDLLSPYWLKSDKPQPIDEELHRLEYYPDMPKREIALGGPRLPLNAQQYSRLVELAGNGLKDPAHMGMGMKDFLNATVQGQGSFGSLYKELGKLDAADGQDRQKAWLRSVIEDYRKKAENRLMHEDTGLQADYDTKNAGKPAGRIPAKIRFLSQ